jgi:riboflavin kinase / FMN adenylyltransferase
MERVRLEPGGARERAFASAVAVGNFDGVHRGHQALVGAAVARARTAGEAAVVLTFDPHPAAVLRPQAAPAALTTLAQKQELVAALGVDRLVVVPFDARLAALAPEAFATEVLQQSVGARHVVVGESFRFGRGRAGDPRALEELGRTRGFGVEVVPPVMEEGRPISSSRVREALAGGRVDEAQRLLGRPYFVDGVVVRGDARGRTLGFPTANLRPEPQILPARGVYAAQCRLADGSERAAVVNVGERPTFGGGRVTLEAHLPGFDGDLYDARLRVSFHHFLRAEQRFASAEALVAQIRADVEAARARLAASGGAV